MDRIASKVGFGWLLVVVLVLAACAPVQPPTGQAANNTAGTTTATTSDELVIYTSRAESLFNPVVEAFNQAHPEVKVTVLTGRGGELGARLLEEKANPQADLFINSDVMAMVDLANQGLFTPNDSASVAAVSTTQRAADGSWTALTLRLRVIMYNTELVTAAELPQSVFDLTDPKWQGQVGATDSTSDAMIAHIAALIKLVGEEQTTAFVKGLVDNGTQFFGGHTDIRKAVGNGELKLGFVNHYYYHLSRTEGAPVGIVYPDQDALGLLVNSTNAGIIQGAKHPAAAQLFIDFLLSPAGQKIFAETNFEYPIVAGVALAEGVEPLDGLKLAAVNLTELYGLREAAKELAQGVGLP